MVREENWCSPKGGKQGIRAMIFTTLIAHIQSKLDKRRRYLRAAAEIGSLTPRDLADLRADPADMLRSIRREIYGSPAGSASR